MILGLAIGTFGYITGNDVATALVNQEDQITVEVSAGDTLWEIADHVKSDDTDIRKAVYEICQANDIQDGSIQSGMILTIPMFPTPTSMVVPATQVISLAHHLTLCFRKTKRLSLSITMAWMG